MSLISKSKSTMQNTFGATSPCPLFSILIVLLLTCLVQTQSLPSTSAHSCAYNYTLRADDSCIQSSQHEYITCVSFSTYLESFNSILGPSDCLQLTLEPGVYQLSKDYLTNMIYSMAISSSAEQNVTVTCLDSTLTNQSTDYTQLSFSTSNSGARTFVSLEGIKFEGCNRPIEFNELESVTITNCTFRRFSASAVDLFNVKNIKISNSLFDNCTTNTGKAQFHGNSGAVSIAYYSSGTEAPISNLDPLFASITNSVFTNNKAIIPPGLSRRTQLFDALNNNQFFGRGGGAGFYVQEDVHNVSALVEDCLFDSNLAGSAGGGLLLLIGGKNTAHKFMIKNNIFTRNKGDAGGALQVGFLIRNVNYPPCQVEILGCHFEDNYAHGFAGALGAVQIYSQGAGNLITVSECKFIRNFAASFGSAVFFASFLLVQNRDESYHYRSHNNLFVSNRGPSGTFGLSFINANFSGINRLENNTGPGLRIVGAQVGLLSGGSLSFIGNNAENHEGGALYMQDFGQMKLFTNTSIEFINNTGRIGSAIVVDVQRSSLVFSQLIFNPQCFLVHENSSLAPEKWTDVSITFSGNRASVGPVVYISHLDHCSWYSAVIVNNVTREVNVTFTIQLFPSWAVFNYKENSNTASSLINGPKDSIYYFQTEPVSITSSSGTSTVPIRPGEQSRLNLVGVDQLGNPTYIIARLYDTRAAINRRAFAQARNTADNMDSDQVQFEPSLLPIQPSDESVIITYGFPNITPEQFQRNEVITIGVNAPFNIRRSKQLFFNLSFEACQPGFELRSRTDGDRLVSCQCVKDDYNILNCEKDVIILRDGQWAAEEHEPTPHLDITPCPASYCRCHYRDGETCETLFFQHDPTLRLQCHPLRNGTLCGRCINGTGVGVLRTNCRECDKNNYFALGFLVVGDAVLVIVILLLAVKLHVIFPPSLKGYMFYIQTVYYATEYFPISFWSIRKYMLFISSALGLYFPWDFCLFPSMTALVSFSPKFTPAIIATVISIIAIVIVYATKSRDGREYVWHGVWSLILLLYAPLVHSCLSLLNCPKIPSADGTEEAYHWYIDGEVKCFQDPGHIVLGIVAIITLFFLVLLIPAVLVFTIIASSKRVQRDSRTVGWLYAALTAGYRDSWEAKGWSSFELFRRLYIIGTAVAFPGRTVANLFAVLNALAVHMFFKPYKKLWQNIMEAVILIIYALLMMIRATPTFLDTLVNYSGTEIPETLNGDLTVTDSVTWLLFPFFYLPLLMGVVFSISAAIYLIVRRVQEAKIRRKYQLQIQTYRASDTSTVNVNTYEHDYREVQDARVRSPNYTKTDVGLDELEYSG